MLIPINNLGDGINHHPSKKLILVIIVIAILVATIIILISFLNNSAKNNTNSPTNVISNLPTSDPKRQLAEKRDRPHFGNANAKLVIVEFSDFQCPVCQAEFPIIREVINKYKDQVFFIYRQYPIINEGSPLVAQASLCANEQDKFWAMHDRLFLNARNDFTSSDLQNIAQQSGLSMDQFNNCLSEEKYKDIVTADTKDGFTLGAPGTPTFFVNGDRLSGQISKNNWEIIINQSLKLLNK